MAKKTDDTAVAVMDAPKTTALTTPVTTRDTRGKESITQEDMQLPRLSVAQKTSPQIDPSKSEYIDGLRLAQMFNSLTKAIYGNGPLEITVVRTSKRAMEFDKENHVVDFNVPLGDARLEFTDGPNGERVKPRATLFYDFLVLLDGEPIVLSLKTTQIKVAKQLNSLLMLTPGPTWARKYVLTSTSKQYGQFSGSAFVVQPGPKTTPEEQTVAEMWYDNTANFAERVDRRESAGSDGDFMDGHKDTDAPF
jgi:hypothetical protein